MEGDFHLTYQIGQCRDFTKDDGRKVEATAIIAPLKATEDGNEVKFKSGCNRWKACHNKECEFSQVSYGGPKKT